MYNNKFSTTVFLCLILGVLVTFSSCEKDAFDLANQPSPALSGTGDFSGITVSNGILTFPSESGANDVIGALEELRDELSTYLYDEYGEEQPNMARYAAIIDKEGPFLGKNPINGEDVPAIELSEQEKVDDDPILYLFEEAFAYNSFRRYLVDEEYDLLDEETFDGDGNDPEDHFIPDEFVRLFLNEDMEYKVGDIVYKIVSSTSILVMDNPTAEQMDDMRAEFAAPVSYTLVQEEPQPGICYGNPIVQGYTSNTTVIDYMEPTTPTACVAAFLASSNPNDPTEITFTNVSSGTYNNVYWQFGDGTSSVDPNPVHNYAQVGTYTVRLTLYDGAVCAVFEDDINVSTSCEADFYFTQSGITRLVSFYDLSLTNGNSSTLSSWAWDFGDGASSTLASPSHTYMNNGSYTVTLTITTSDNCTDTHTEIVNVVAGCCKTNKAWKNGSGSAPIGVGNSRGYKGKVWITSLVGIRRVGSKTVCYRQRNNGNWVKERADYIFTSNGGQVRDPQCAQTVAFSQNETGYNDKKVTAGYTFSYGIKIQQGDIGSVYEFDDAGSNNWTGYGGLLNASQCN